MSQRYFICFAYDGTNYHGWQYQPNGISVQEVMTAQLRKLFGPQALLVAAGRTDAGVHAKTMYAHFDCPHVLEDVAAFARKLDLMLPWDISIHEVMPVRNDAHARFDATSRTYEYWLGYHKDRFFQNYYLKLFRPMDFEAMNRMASILLEYRDFSCFSKAHTDVKTNNCVVKKAFWEQRGDFWVFTIQADRFLRNMVRAVVGTLIEVGWGKLDEAKFREVIASKNRCKAGTSVLAKGLFLVDVTYPEDVFDPTAPPKPRYSRTDDFDVTTE